jgi:hypothetical protein
MQWAKKCGDKLVDLGSPLAGGQKLSPSGSTASNLNIAGYSVLQAENMEEPKNYCKVSHILAGMLPVPLKYMKQCQFPACKKEVSGKSLVHGMGITWCTMHLQRVLYRLEEPMR